MPIYFKQNLTGPVISDCSQSINILLKIAKVIRRNFTTPNNRFAYELEKKQRDNEIMGLVKELRNLVTDSAIIQINPNIKHLRIVQENLLDVTIPLDNWPMFDNCYMVGNLANNCWFVYGNETFKII